MSEKLPLCFPPLAASLRCLLQVLQMLQGSSHRRPLLLARLSGAEQGKGSLGRTPNSNTLRSTSTPPPSLFPLTGGEGSSLLVPLPSQDAGAPGPAGRGAAGAGERRREGCAPGCGSGRGLAGCEARSRHDTPAPPFLLPLPPPSPPARPAPAAARRRRQPAHSREAARGDGGAPRSGPPPPGFALPPSLSSCCSILQPSFPAQRCAGPRFLPP